MKYVYTTDPGDVVDYLANHLIEHLKKDERVLWLLSGGSAITTAVKVSKIIAEYNLTKLSVSLVDERFGAVGHDNENWKQLIDKGLALPGADLYRPLIGQDRAATSEAYGDWIRNRVQETDYSIGLFGIGADGHTAGIKPDSPATTDPGWSIDYAHEDFERFTMTFHAITQLDEAVLQVMGDDKAQAVHSLLTETISPEIQPSQIFKQSKESILFTDYKEKTV